MSLNYNGKLIPNARTLRKNMTPWERKLWFMFLKEYPVRFQRQKTIDEYIVDFYCHQAKIAIELDGSQHYNPPNAAEDEQRTRRLEKCGIRVIRIPNNEIDKNFSGVCEFIDCEVKNSLSQLR